MIAVFLLPFQIREVKAPYLWFFYKTLYSLNQPIYYLGSNDYLKDPSVWAEEQRWEVSEFAQKHLNYTVPSVLQLVSIKENFHNFSADIFQDLLASSHGNPSGAFKSLLTTVNDELKHEVTHALKEIQGLETILTMCNCPSLSSAAADLGVPVIHIELGPLRFPEYLPTAYFDFKGVNGNSEAEEVFIRHEVEWSSLALDSKNIVEIFRRTQFQSKPIEFKLGLPLQVEDDSNLIAFGNNYTNRDLINHALQSHSHNEILIRAHPGGFFEPKHRQLKIDSSPTSIDFIQKCKKIITVNSSVGFEAILAEKDVDILGDASFGYISKIQSKKRQGDAISHYLLRYLTSFESAFNPEYIRFRLKMPSNETIAVKHLIDHSLTLRRQIRKLEAEITQKGQVELELAACREDIEKLIEDLEKQRTQKDQVELELAACREDIEKLIEDLEKQRKLSADHALSTLTLMDIAKSRGSELQDAQSIIEKAERENSEKQNLISHKDEVIETLRKQTETQDSQLQALSKYAHSLELKNAALTRSKSWRLTLPIRIVSTFMRGDWNGISRYRDKLIERARKRLCKPSVHPSSSGLQPILRASTSPDTTNVEANIEIGSQGKIDASIEINSLFKTSKSFVILTTAHCLYLAKLIKDQLSVFNINGSIITQKPEGGYSERVHIVICPQMFSELPDCYIAYQMEQSVNSRWFTDKYIQILQQSTAILDYSLRNIEYLQDAGIDYKKIYYVPLSIGGPTEICPEVKKEYDVLFYGDDACERRKLYLNAISKKYKIKIINSIFGDALLKEIQKARVVVNIHYYEGALLETTRIYEALSQGAIIVSESSVDIDCHISDLESMVDFVEVGSIEKMLDRIDYWVGNKEACDLRASQILDRAKSKITSFEFYFARFLLAHDFIGYDEFYSHASDYLSGIGDKLCLGLPETTARRRSFDLDNKYGFQYCAGLRHRIGWVGCGLSYKFLINRAKDCGLDFVTICEDDVSFDQSFQEKYAQALSLLRSTNEWDIFSGLLANLHPETKILCLLEHNNHPFVKINRLISMVFNVYSNRVYDLIISWDHSNRDPIANTIDRYLESFDSISLISTPSFLVGHKEELNSTLWGFNNKTYKRMISDSQRLLGDKIIEFLQRPIN